MLLPALVLLTVVASAPPVPASERDASSPRASEHDAAAVRAASREAPRAPALRPRPLGQCRVVGLRPTLAGRSDSTGPAAEDPAPLASPDENTAGTAAAAGSRAPKRGRSLRRPYYSTARTLDLELGAVVRRGVSPDTRLELRLYTPHGHLYQTLRARAPDASARTSSSAGASSNGSARRFRPRWPWTATLPVAGTAIVNHSLYGQWTVAPHLDGRPEPCGPSGRFWIGP